MEDAHRDREQLRYLDGQDLLQHGTGAAVRADGFTESREDQLAHGLALRPTVRGRHESSEQVHDGISHLVREQAGRDQPSVEGVVGHVREDLSATRDRGVGLELVDLFAQGAHMRYDSISTLDDLQRHAPILFRCRVNDRAATDSVQPGQEILLFWR